MHRSDRTSGKAILPNRAGHRARSGTGAPACWSLAHQNNSRREAACIRVRTVPASAALQLRSGPELNSNITGWLTRGRMGDSDVQDRKCRRLPDPPQQYPSGLPTVTMGGNMFRWAKFAERTMSS